MQSVRVMWMLDGRLHASIRFDADGMLCMCQHQQVTGQSVQGTDAEHMHAIDTEFSSPDSAYNELLK